MEFVRVIEGYDIFGRSKLKTKRLMNSPCCSVTWTNGDYLLDFFMEHFEDLKRYFHIERIDEAVSDTFENADALQELVLDFPYAEHLDRDRFVELTNE